MTKKQLYHAADLFMLGTEQLMKLSLLVLHILLVLFAVPAMMGQSAPDLANMFDSTLTAILWNLGVMGGNKAAQKVANRFGAKEETA